MSTPVETCSLKVTLEQVGDVAGELDDLEPSLHLPEGVVNGLAMLGGEELGDVEPTGRHQLAEGKHDVLTLGQRREAPGLEGVARRPDGGVHIGCRCQWHLGGLVHRWPG